MEADLTHTAFCLRLSSLLRLFPLSHPTFIEQKLFDVYWCRASDCQLAICPSNKRSKRAREKKKKTTNDQTVPPGSGREIYVPICMCVCNVWIERYEICPPWKNNQPLFCRFVALPTNVLIVYIIENGYILCPSQHGSV